MMLAKTIGLELAYETFGEGEAILLISGLGTQMIRWDDAFCGALAARGYCVIRFDNRDAGLSTHLSHEPAPDFGTLAAALMAGERPAVPYSLLDMATDAVGLLDALGVERAHVVGRSMGGMIAQCMATEFPDRVLSLTSVMSGTGNPAMPQAAPDVMALMQRPKPDPAADPEGFATASLAFARRIAGGGAEFDAVAQKALALEEARRAHDPAGFGRQLAAMATAGDRRAKLATLTLPVLVIHGADDPLIPPECGADTAASIPGAELLLVEGMGHDIPQPFHARIIDAIQGVARRTA
ncbi:alpha/beta fold hydrolase [Psychromarinibacter sp. S121]|uniref:alpha/beta fold hydrolase n=1 Tax=Psychromarinibacter sp. S121 TaxID=3415127 RepID=UPI003C7CECE7